MCIMCVPDDLHRTVSSRPINQITCGLLVLPNPRCLRARRPCNIAFRPLSSSSNTRLSSSGMRGQ
jgi:hypothetical protein